MKYKELFKQIHKNGNCPVVQFMPHVRALGISNCPDPSTRARLISVSKADFENRVTFVFDFNGFEEYNSSLSDRLFQDGVCTLSVSLFSHFFEEGADFFQIVRPDQIIKPTRQGQQAKPLEEQLRDLVSIAELFELYDAAEYLREEVKKITSLK